MPTSSSEGRITIRPSTSAESSSRGPAIRQPGTSNRWSPPSSGADLSPRLILTPLLAFDRAGRRLGQGGGHYDRIISLYRAHGAIAAGLAYAEQEMGEVPAGAHEALLDWVITPKEAIRCGAQGLRGRAE